MLIRKNVSTMLRRYKAANGLSLMELSEALDIPTSSLQCYLKEQSNLRADTIELLAEKLKVPLIVLIAGRSPKWDRANIVVQTIREIGALPAGQREQGVQLFLQLVDLLGENT